MKTFKELKVGDSIFSTGTNDDFYSKKYFEWVITDIRKTFFNYHFTLKANSECFVTYIIVPNDYADRSTYCRCCTEVELIGKIIAERIKHRNLLIAQYR